MATIRRRGSRWQAQIRRSGHPPLTSSHSTRREAEIWARAVEAQLDRDEHTNPQRRPAEQAQPVPPGPCNFRLAEVVARYIETVSSRKKGAAIERAILGAFLRHPICRQPVTTLSQRDFAAYRDHRLTGVLPTTLRREFSILHHMFEIARGEWGLPVPTNPLKGLTIGALRPHRERRLRTGEEEALLSAAAKSRNQLITPIIRLAIETGLRRSELLRLEWPRVDLKQRLLLIPDSKNGRPRHVVLTQSALAVMLSLPRKDQRVFELSCNALRLAWERIKRRAGVEDLHFHDLRHEALSRFFEMGLTVPEVAALSGHRDPRMLFRYSHAMRERILETMDRSACAKPRSTGCRHCPPLPS
jgi:integrase